MGLMLTLFPASGSENFRLMRNAESVSLLFDQPFSFEHISLPAVSTMLWGEKQRCSAVTVVIGSTRFIGSAGATASSIEIDSDSAISNRVEIIPLFMSQIDYALASEPQLTLVAASIKGVEERFSQLAQQVYQFNQQNQCFSCHYSFPLAIAADEAQSRGFRIPRQSLQLISQHMLELQNSDGSFHFSAQPDYGTITPTLCGGAIMALLSRTGIDTRAGIQLIANLLPMWQDQQGRLMSDFFFRPLFIGQPSSTIFETIIISALYHMGTQDSELLRLRLNQLDEWARNYDSPSSLNLAILMSAMPYIFRINGAERQIFAHKFISFVNDEPEASQPEIQTLVNRILWRLGALPPKPAAIDPENLADEIWNLVNDILYLPPAKANRNDTYADN